LSRYFSPSESFNIMHLPKNQTLESPESSSPVVTRAVSAGLRGKTYSAYTFSPFQNAGLNLLGRFPSRFGRKVISQFQAISSLDPKVVEDLRVENLVEERLLDYAALRGRFPAAVIGAALGGASAHVSLALDGPFLPQSFVLTLRGGSPRGDVESYFQRSHLLALDFASRNPGTMTIQHYDPVHDEWLTRYANHLRIKLLDLPPAYIDFLKLRLEPGGAVVYLDCGAQWLRYRIGKHSTFQVGGWGDIPAQEYLDGSERLLHYCQMTGLEQCGWRLADYPVEQGPESEWGSEPGLAEALEKFCRQEGYRFVKISLPAPHDYTRLAFQAVGALLQKEGREPAGVIVEMFSQFDATAVIHSGLLPVWLIFNTWDSLEVLKNLVPHFPKGKPVFFSPLSTFTETPDLAPFPAWEAALSGLDWRNIGARATHYPADALALATWQKPLRAWVEANNHPIRARLSAEELSRIDYHV
jgi:hypothetical protein